MCLRTASARDAAQTAEHTDAERANSQDAGAGGGHREPGGRRGSDRLRPWCKAEDCWQVQYEVYRALLERFREQDIPIAYPVREIRMRPAKA